MVPMTPAVRDSSERSRRLSLRTAVSSKPIRTNTRLVMR
jgi:hypothetical protein